MFRPCPSCRPYSRVYEGCARAYIGAVEDANIIKLHRDAPQVSYLSYPQFERDPHPALAASLLVPLQTFRIQHRDYSGSNNPPILHRKEAFLSDAHPLYPKFSRLTRQEEKWGLYDKAARIGTRRGWEQILTERGIRLAGHRLVRRHESDKRPLDGGSYLRLNDPVGKKSRAGRPGCDLIVSWLGYRVRLRYPRRNGSPAAYSSCTLRAPDGHLATTARTSSSEAALVSMTNFPSSTLKTCGRLLTQFAECVQTILIPIDFHTLPSSQVSIAAR